MKQMEELLHRDRAAGVPQPPEARYTIAAINHRLGIRPAATDRPKQSEWLPILAALCLMLVALLYVGLNPWFLGAIAFVTVCSTPILLRKGA